LSVATWGRDLGRIMHAIAEHLFAPDQPLQLIGGRDRQSGRIVFPCPSGPGFEPIKLGRTGTLWSWTIQRFRPKSPPYSGPEAFEPWAIGYVELPGEVIVEARIVGIPLDGLTIGMSLELTAIALDPGADDPRMIPAFQPDGRHP